MRPRIKQDLKMTTSVLAVILMVSISAIGFYASTLEVNEPEPTGDVFIEGDWKQASVRGYNNGRFTEEINSKNNFSLSPTADPTVFIGNAHGIKFACLLMGDYLFWEYETEVGRYTAVVNLLPGCLVVNEIFVSTHLNTKENYVSINVYTPDGKIPVWFKYWDISRLQAGWTNATAFSLYHDDGGEPDQFLPLQGKRFYIKSIDGPLFLAEMQLMVGTETVTRPIQGIVISSNEEGIIAMVTDSEGYNWILECNDEILVMRAVFQSETAKLAGKFVSIQRTYVLEGNTSTSDLVHGVFHTDDEWKITGKKVIDMQGNIEPPAPLAVPSVRMSDTKGSGFICNDIDMGMGAGILIDLVGYTVRSYDDSGKYWIFADVVYPKVVDGSIVYEDRKVPRLDSEGQPMYDPGNGDPLYDVLHQPVLLSTSGYGKYNSEDNTIVFEFYLKTGDVTKLYQYTFEKIV